MSSSTDQPNIQAWLTGLSQPESKRRESTALAIAKAPIFDRSIVDWLKEIALNDPKAYAREAAKMALSAIAASHLETGKAIEKYLEQLRIGVIAPRPLSPQPELEKKTQPPPAQPAPVTIAETLPVPLPTAETQPAPPPVLETQPVAATPVFKDPQPKRTVEPQVPFDQWLLSERNIKLALYAGGFLLLLAGLIFVGVNWSYLPGIAKLGVTLAVTIGMYIGGTLLFRRPNLQIGGIALLAIASAFLPLNFVVTHLYLTSDLGISLDTIWFIASLVCGTVYAFTALRTSNNVFTAYLLAAILSATTALVLLLGLTFDSMPLVFACVTVAIFGVSLLFAFAPLLYSWHLAYDLAHM